MQEALLGSCTHPRMVWMAEHKINALMHHLNQKPKQGFARGAQGL